MKNKLSKSGLIGYYLGVVKINNNDIKIRILNPFTPVIMIIAIIESCFENGIVYTFHELIETNRDNFIWF